MGDGLGENPLTLINDDDDEEEGVSNSLLNIQSVGGERVPPFLSKLFQIVSQPATDHCIRWSTTGDSFLVEDHHIFSKQVIPQFFKHSSLCSFIRQLNTYGFRKRTNMGSSSDQMEFFNDNFRRGHVDLLCRIKRTGQTKGSSRSVAGTPPSGPMRGPSPAYMPADAPASLQLRPGSNSVLHATKTDLMHVQQQVNALIAEVRDMRKLMHQYMMEVDKRVNLFSMEMHGVAGQWYQVPVQPAGGPFAGDGQNGLVGGPSRPLDAAACASLAVMASQPPA